MNSSARMSILASAFLLSAATGCAWPARTADLPNRAPSARVPVIHITDLFHPYMDLDDHYDLAGLYAMPEIDLRGIVLDNSYVTGVRPHPPADQATKGGQVAVHQMNHLTGRNVPCAIGLSAKLTSPSDTGTRQPAEVQGGVQMILDILAASSEKVTITAVGSMRDLAAAYNRDPALLVRKVDKVVIFIGNATAPGSDPEPEWNVALDTQAWISVVRSRMPIYWVPCWDGPWTNNGRASYAYIPNSIALLQNARDGVKKFYLYAHNRLTSDPIAYLDAPVDQAALGAAITEGRKLWCTAVLPFVAGRKYVWDGARAITIPAGQATSLARYDLFDFQDVTVDIVNEVNGDTAYGSGKTVKQFRRLKNQATFDRDFASVVGHLYEQFPILVPSTATPVAEVETAGGEVAREGNDPANPIVSIVFRGPKVNDASLVSLRRLPALRSIVLRNTTVTDAGMAELAGHAELRSVDIAGSLRITDAGLAHLKTLTGLESLNLSGEMLVTDAGLAHLEDMGKLQVIKLSGTPITDAGLGHLRAVSSLRSVSLINVRRITDAGLVHLGELAGLQFLTLNGAHVTDAGLAHLRGLKDLELLDISGTAITDAGLAEIAGLSNLKTLALSDTDVTNRALEILKPMAGLQSLDISSTGITDEGLARFGLPGGLRMLNLQDTPVGDAGLKALSGLASLRTLILKNDAITDAGLAHIERLPQLKVIDLEGTGVSPEGRQDFERKLKALRGSMEQETPREK